MPPDSSSRFTAKATNCPNCRKNSNNKALGAQRGPKSLLYYYNTIMKQIIFTLACAALILGTPATAKVKKSGKNTVEIRCSQGFQGPEEWVRLQLPVDKKGFITLFDGTSLDGWRGYGKTKVPSKWRIEDGCLTFVGKDDKGEGGDIIFGHKFKNFILEMEWKVAKGANSGIFYLGQETTDENGRLQPIYISCPEYQVLDNANHPDAKLGKDGNRMSASLYDMIPAKPQNQKPYGEWNTTKIVVNHGTVEHWQNGVKVLTYQLWTPQWVEMLQNCKFSEKAWPAAFRLLKNCGGPNHEGLIGMQDHGDRVWYRNIRVKPLCCGACKK